MAKTKEKPKTRTKAFREKFKGKPMFAIWAVDAEGEKVGDAPIIAFGEAKARALNKHKDKLEKFVAQLDEVAEEGDEE